MDLTPRRRESSSRFRSARTRNSLDDTPSSFARLSDNSSTSRSFHLPTGLHSRRASSQSGEVPAIPCAYGDGSTDSDSSLKLEEDLATLEAQAKRREQQSDDQGQEETLAPVQRAKARLNSMVPAIKRGSAMAPAGGAGKKRSNSLGPGVGGLRNVVALAAAKLPESNVATKQELSIPNTTDRRSSRKTSSVPAPAKRLESRDQGRQTEHLRHASPSPSNASDHEKELNVPRRGFGSHGSRGGSASSGQGGLATNPLLEGVRMGAVLALERVAVYRTGYEILHQMFDLRCKAGTILFEGENSQAAFGNDSVFIIEEGCVDIEDNGERLGAISRGGIFGEGPAFGHSEVQLFTVKLANNSETNTVEDSLGCWCIPMKSVTFALRQFPDARLLLEERIAEQTKKLLGPRAFRLLFFSHCGSGFQERLLPKMGTSHYRKGAEIVKGGEEADSMLMIVSGSIKLGHPKIKTPKGHTTRRSTISGAMAQRASVGTTGSNVRRASTLGSDDIDATIVSNDDDDASSFDSTISSEGEFLPKLMDDMRPSPKVTAISTEAVCCGEGILLGFHSTMGRRMTAVQDCIVLSLGKDDFVDVVERHPRERSSFQELTAARYQELRRSDIARLANVDLFSRCSDAFLAKVAKVSTLQLFFTGSYIIAEGFAPKGVLLLMAGRAEQITEDGDVTRVDSPNNFGTLEWLGVSDAWEQVTLRATELCLVFLISREHLLLALKDHPEESTAMVQQVLRHNGIRMSVSHTDLLAAKNQQVGVVTAPSNRRALAQVHNVWHMPFCKGCDPGFVAKFTVELKVCKLIPGQLIFSHAPWEKDAKKEDLDFLVILVNGTVQIDETPRNSDVPGQSWKYVHSPLVVTGFNRKHRAMVVTSSVCDIHRLTVSSCSTLSKEYPNDLRKVLQRMLQFQQQREVKLGASWWCPTKSLRHQAWFKDSDEDFLNSVVENLHTELYLPGEWMVVEGDPADSTMLLECGTAVIEKVDSRSLYSSDRIGDVHDGYWIGEMAMFAGESKRRASIKAVTACKIQRLYNKVLVRLLDAHPTERQRFRQLAEHRLRAVEKERLEDHDFFKDLDRTFLNLLRQKCKPQVFFANEIMMKQGDVADSLFILGQDSVITLESDGYKGKKLIGRACLGTKALLSTRPVKRASTVITQNVCAVRVLTRDDWLDALKLCEDHQRWLGSFIKQQMAKIGEERSLFLKRRAWDKIQQREMCATILHCDRIADPDYDVRSFAKRRPRHLASIETPRTDSRTTSKITQPSQVTRPLPHPPQIWDCFNGLKAKVPHTCLPRLGNLEAEVLAMMSTDGDDEEEQRSLESPSRQSFVQFECEEALGVVLSP